MNEGDYAALGIAESYRDIAGDDVAVPLTTRALIAEKLSGPDVTRRAAAPGEAYLPDKIAQGGKAWGIAVQLYAVRSSRNWGIGDFTDLAAIVRWAADLGADYVGVNPLHALFLAEPGKRSPYSPSSRLFLNPLYIDPDRAPGASPDSRDPAISTVLAEAHRGDLIDYDAVARAKRPALEAAFAAFAGDAAFDEFIGAGGAGLRDHAVFEALADHFTAAGSPGGFLAWPEAYQRPDTDEVLAFADANPAAIRFHSWLQWVADRQLAEASGVGGTVLYLDLAVGAAPDGSEVWSGGDRYVRGLGMGAPPDPMAMSGQDWGLAPLNPRVLEAADFAPLKDVLAASMRHAGALRIDHVLGFARQFWVPAGQGAAMGGNVSFPQDGMIAATAALSRQAACLVVGEDLGVVPPGLTDALRSADMLGYTVARWARDENGDFLRADEYPRQSLTVTSTHDIAPIAGWFSGSDIDARAVFEPDSEAPARAERARELSALLALWGVDAASSPDEVVKAAHRFMAATPSAVTMAALEDILLQEIQVNMPGTLDEHPNWRVRYARDLEDWTTDDEVRNLALAAAR